jgi:hypothetical protein
VLSGRGIYDGLITHPEEFYGVWYVVMLSRNLINVEALPSAGQQHYRKRNS